MAGRPKIVKSIQSYVNLSDNNSGLGPLKAGTAPKVGVSRNFWFNFQTECTQSPNDFKQNPLFYQTVNTQSNGIWIRPQYSRFRPSPRQISSIYNFSQN